MKKCVRMLAGVVFFGALAIGARAQVADQIVAKVPYPFVVGDKTLPAGEYRVNRIRFEDENELGLTSVENKAGVLVISNEVEDTRENAPRLVFAQINGQHLLTKIQTTEHVFMLPVSRKAVLQATAKPQPAAAGSTAGTD